MRVMAFDFGKKYTGLAVGDTTTSTAQGIGMLATKECQAGHFNALDKLIKQWAPKLIIVGLPYHMNGNEGAMVKHAKKFAHLLTQHTGLEHRLWDERLSSWDAKQKIDDIGGKLSNKAIQQGAAAVILQEWLHNNQEVERKSPPLNNTHGDNVGEIDK